MIMRRGASSGKGSGYGPLLTPTDGSLDDGALPLTPDTKLHDAVDKMNEFLASKFPEPSLFGDSNAVSDARLWSSSYVGGSSSFNIGSISDSNGAYPLGTFSPADVQNITQATTLQFATAGLVNKLNDGSSLSLSIDYGSGFVPLSSFTLSGTAAQSGGNSAATFSVFGTDDGTNTGSPTPGQPLVAQASGAYAGTIQLDIDFTDSLVDAAFRTSGGFFNLRVDHVVESSTYSNLFSDFTAGGATSGAALWEREASAFPAAPSIAAFDLALNVLGTPRNLSGVPYASTGATFDITGSASNVFLKSYGRIPPSDNRVYSLALADLATTDQEFNGPAVSANNPPRYDDPADLSAPITVGSTAVGILDARPVATLFDPYNTGSGIQAQSPSHGIRIATHSDPASQGTSYAFTSEKFRGTSSLDTHDYDGTGPTELIAGSSPIDWDSSQNITSYDSGNGLQVIPGTGLSYPAVNFSGGIPAGGPDYSSAAGTRYFWGFFQEASPRSNGNITWTGGPNFDQIKPGSPIAHVYLRIPESGFGWFDIADPAGCFFSKVNDRSVNVSFASMSSTNSTEFILPIGTQSVFYVLVKIEYLNNSVPAMTGINLQNQL